MECAVAGLELSCDNCKMFFDNRKKFNEHTKVNWLIEWIILFGFYKIILFQWHIQVQRENSRYMDYMKELLIDQVLQEDMINNNKDTQVEPTEAKSSSELRGPYSISKCNHPTRRLTNCFHVTMNWENQSKINISVYED